MSGTEETFHYTKEDLRKLESRETKAHGGKIPKDAEASIMKSIVDSKTESDRIEERKANLPLPEDPPVASDWTSLNAKTVNVGSGGVEDDISYGKGSAVGLREPAGADSSVRIDGEEWKKQTAPDSGIGRQGHDHLEGLPKDALAR